MGTRLARVLHRGQSLYVRVEGEWAQPLEGEPFEKIQETGTRFRLSEATLLPVTTPSKVIAVGVNYRSHALEMKKTVPEEPLLFLKATSALNASGQAIVLPPESQEVHHEAELALVVGRRMKRSSEAEALSGIFAVTCFNDVTARDLQRKDVQFTRGKSFDTFACVGPWMVPISELIPDNLRVLCRVNGQVRQDGRTSDMVFPVARLVSFISHAMTLLPGDLIPTGTPSGVGPLRAGDTVEVEIEGIGTLTNPVQRAP
jgi:2-keto-4-pentenoate hydratase/2-oxohepta-3-ene-1,7-dioic acid hydratase in catechol pathway